MRISFKNIDFTRILAGLGCIAGIGILLLFPSQTSFGRWQGYHVLAVSLDASEKEVLKRLLSQGIGDVVSESNTHIENKSPEAPIQPFLAAINTARSAWFINTTQRYRYFYLKDTPFLETKITDALKTAEISWNLEKTDNFTIIPFFICGVFGIALLLVSKNRLYQFFCSIPFVILSVTSNSLSGTISSILALYSLSLVADLSVLDGKNLTQKQLILRVQNQGQILIPLAGAFFAGFSSGFQSGLLFCASLCASISLISLVSCLPPQIEKFKNRRRLHPVFRAQIMHPELLRQSLPRYIILFASISCIMCVVTGTLFFNFRSNHKAAFKQDLYIPAPSGYTGNSGFDIEGYSETRAKKEKTDLPDLTDFLSTQWLIQTFPYRRVQEQGSEPTRESKAEYIDYSIDDKGLISPENHLMNTFNTDFIRKRLALDSTPLEKMLIRQNRFVTVALKTGDDVTSSPLSSFFMRYLLYIFIPGAAIFMRLKK